MRRRRRTLGRVAAALAALAVVGIAAYWWLTRPTPLDAQVFAGLAPDLARGEEVFHAAGCAGCHAAPDAEGEARLVLAGGERFPSEFGTFVAPNISSHPQAGIGAWSDAEVLEAVVNGVSPEGAHYYPAFPYTAYHHAEPADLVSLVAYLRGLPASDRPSAPHEVGFPFEIRRNVGLWKRLYLRDDWAVAGELSPEAARGRYLVEALGHCGECHTPRDALGGLDRSRWLGGAPNPSGRGRIPDITPAGLDWSQAEIAEYLASGFTPDFDTAGGLMVEVIEGTSRLPARDRADIAAYLKAVPGVAE